VVSAVVAADVERSDKAVAKLAHSDRRSSDSSDGSGSTQPPASNASSRRSQESRSTHSSNAASTHSSSSHPPEHHTQHKSSGKNSSDLGAPNPSPSQPPPPPALTQVQRSSIQMHSEGPRAAGISAQQSGQKQKLALEGLASLAHQQSMQTPGARGTGGGSSHQHAASAGPAVGRRSAQGAPDPRQHATRPAASQSPGASRSSRQQPR